MPDTPPSTGATWGPTDPWLMERLLAGPAAALDKGEEQLAAVLAALRAPASDAELARQQDHVLGFVAARAVDGMGPPPERGHLRRLPARTVVAAAALAVLAGTAIATTGSLLPGSDRNADRPQASTPSAGPTAVGPAPAAPTPSPARVDSSSFRTPTTGGSSTPAAAAVPRGLCVAYSRGGLAATSTAHASLVAAAGGPERIDAFCASLLGSRDGGQAGSAGSSRTIPSSDHGNAGNSRKAKKANKANRGP